MSGESWTRGEAILLTTIGEDGYPHHAFLSEGEWAESGSLLKVSLPAGSRTSTNARLRCHARFLHVLNGEPVLMKLDFLSARTPMEADPGRELIEFRVLERTIARTPPGETARLTGAFSFERLEHPGETERRRRVKEELCH